MTPTSSFFGTAWLVYDIVAAIFIIVDIVLVVGFVYVFRKASRFHPDYRPKEKTGPAVHKETMHDIVMRERWHATAAKFALGTPEAARVAIIEADSLVDAALKNMQIEGEHLADRLSNLESDDIESMPRIWRAHRMRNDLVHTPGFMVTPQDAERTMRDYEAFLREIGVIE
ncbi:MAG: hypothetical protein P4L67_01120 [Candidatus Pacebacteria bacterium]|nr:hypothetical protein [Candidatus Paceibacterota bacterium]